jgi:hypothetical protein
VGENIDVGQIFEVFGDVRLGQAGGCDQLRRIPLTIAAGENQFEPTDFPPNARKCAAINFMAASVMF